LHSADDVATEWLKRYSSYEVNALDNNNNDNQCRFYTSLMLSLSYKRQCSSAEGNANMLTHYVVRKHLSFFNWHFQWFCVYCFVSIPLLPLPRSICNRRCSSVCLLATLRKNFVMDLHEILRESWQWASEQMIKFWWRSGSRIQLRIATLVRGALAEVCTVPVLLVFKCQIKTTQS